MQYLLYIYIYALLETDEILEYLFFEVMSSEGTLSCDTYLQELQESREQLKAEQKKVFRLEVQLAEANEKLDQIADLEKQLNNYRQIFCHFLMCSRIHSNS